MPMVAHDSMKAEDSMTAEDSAASDSQQAEPKGHNRVNKKDSPAAAAQAAFVAYLVNPYNLSM